MSQIQEPPEPAAAAAGAAPAVSADDAELHRLGYPRKLSRRMSAFDNFAPYRRRQSYWPFFFQTADPTLHAQLASPVPWDPSSYDGDSSFE